MADSNYSAMFIVFMGLIIIALFTLMVVSSIGAGKSTDTKTTCPDACGTGCDPNKPNKCAKACHTYSMWTAIGCGVIVGLTIIALIIYLYTNKKLIHTDVKNVGQQVGQGFQQFGQNIQQYAQ